MRLLSLLSGLLVLPALTLSHSLTVSVPTSQQLQNPSVLPPTTTASLMTLSHEYIAHLNTQNHFVFRNVSAGSYLLEIMCASHGFAPLRVDIRGDGTVEAWRTFRGNEWENKGEAVMASDGKTVEAKLLGHKGYYMERAGCEFSIFHSCTRRFMGIP
jgi:hypothetical protein